MKKTIILVDIYACCKCATNQKHNIRCITSCKRDDPLPGECVPQPAVLKVCPKYATPCVWTYFQTTRETVKV